jgi:hypothetical protein
VLTTLSYAQLVSLWRRFPRPTTWITWLAGLALIAVGILCLSLSGAVARGGTWWQGTWQALGVGFVVGGVVDVLAISTMSQYASAWQRRWDNEAAAIVTGSRTTDDAAALYVLRQRAAMLLSEHGETLDPELRSELVMIVRDVAPKTPRRGN